MSDRVLVTLDHEIRDADTPLLYADDLAVVRGDGVFETLLVDRGRACKVEPHLARLRSSARALGLPDPELDDWRLSIDLAAEQWGNGREGVMRLVLSRGREAGGEPTAFVMVGPLSDAVRSARRDGVAVLTLDRGFSTSFSANAPWQLLGAKTLSYATNMAALRYASHYGSDDVIFLSSEGNVLEGPRSSVVIARGKTLVTPPPEQGILPGTTQRALYSVARSKGFRCEYAPLRPADLIVSEGIWLVSSVTKAARVHTMDGVRMPEAPRAQEFAELVDIAVETAGVDSSGA